MIDVLRLCRLYYSIPMSPAYTLTLCYALGETIADGWRGTLLSTVALALAISAAYATMCAIFASIASTLPPVPSRLGVCVPASRLRGESACLPQL